MALVEVVRPATIGSRRGRAGGSARRVLGQGPRPVRPTRRASSSTASTGRSRSRRCGCVEAGRGVRRGDRRRRCGTPASRWARSSSWTSSGSTSTSRRRRGVWDGLGQPDRLRPSPIQERLVGRRPARAQGGAGFYRYRPGRRNHRRRVRATDHGAGGRGDRRGGSSPRSPRRRSVPVTRASPAEADIDLALRLGAAHPIGPFERLGR